MGNAGKKRNVGNTESAESMAFAKNGKCIGKSRRAKPAERFAKAIAMAANALLAAALLAGCSTPGAGAGGGAGVGEGSGAGAQSVTLRCGVKQAHAPFSYIDEQGNLVGLEEDVVNEAFRRIDGYEVEIVGFDASPALFAALQAGNIDFGSGQYVASAARREIYKFPKQYYALSPMYLISRVDDNFQTLRDIAGETLEFASTSYEKEIIDAYNIANPGYEIKMVDASGDVTGADYLQQIATGQRNVLLQYKSTFDMVKEELQLDSVTLSEEPVIVEDVYQVFHGDVADEFIQKFDDALRAMLEDGTLGKISEEWGGEDYIALYKDKVIAVG
jgi:L-cystine transport system substrate-binding protein